MRPNIHPSIISHAGLRSHTQKGFRVTSQPNVHVFGLLEGTGVPEENTQTQGRTSKERPQLGPRTLLPWCNPAECCWPFWPEASVNYHPCMNFLFSSLPCDSNSPVLCGHVESASAVLCVGPTQCCQSFLLSFFPEAPAGCGDLCCRPVSLTCFRTPPSPQDETAFKKGRELLSSGIPFSAP